MLRAIGSLALTVLIVGCGTCGLEADATAATVTMHACSGGTPLSTAWTSQGGTAGSAVSAVNCTPGHRMRLVGGGDADVGTTAHWRTTAPSGMRLLSFAVPAGSAAGGALINQGDSNDSGGSGFQASYGWSGGQQLVVDSGQNCCGGAMDYARAAGGTIGGNTFVVQARCTFTNQRCAFYVEGNEDVVDVEDLTLVAEDDVKPTLSGSPALGSGSDLVQAGGRWVRGPYSLWFTASNGPGSGVCGDAAYLDGAPLAGGTSQAPDQTQWLQCPASRPFSSSVNTANYANGEHALELDSVDAASPSNHGSESLQVGFDNVQPTVSLAGSHDVASSGATEDVTANATAGPSGVRDIVCSVDGGSAQIHSGASAQIAVAGAGAHTVSCYSQNNAVNNSGQVADSATQNFQISLRAPTIALSTFAKIADREVCRRTHGHRRCRPRTERKRVVSITVGRRHGRQVRLRRVRHIRIALRPHVIAKPRLRVRYDQRAVLHGVLGSGGRALAGQRVTVEAAPENGFGRYARIRTVTTNVSGTWSATIPAGPSRLLRAVYAGTSTFEPATSAPVTLTVPAKIRIQSIDPGHVAWGGTIHIHGKLDGGYLPQGGALVRLRYGIGGSATTYGVRAHVGGDGRFSTSFTFGSGNPADHVRVAFQVATLPTGNYPFAPARSNTVDVTVGGSPTAPSARHRAHHRRRHHHRHRKRSRHRKR